MQGKPLSLSYRLPPIFYDGVQHADLSFAPKISAMAWPRKPSSLIWSDLKLAQIRYIGKQCGWAPRPSCDAVVLSYYSQVALNSVELFLPRILFFQSFVMSCWELKLSKWEVPSVSLAFLSFDGLSSLHLFASMQICKRSMTSLSHLSSLLSIPCSTRNCLIHGNGQHVTAHPNRVTPPLSLHATATLRAP